MTRYNSVDASEGGLRTDAVAYVIPRLVADGVDHYAAVIGLLSALTVHTTVDVIALSGAPIIIDGVRLVEILPSSPFKRAVALVRALHRARARGVRTYFVRVSSPAGVIVGLWARATGGVALYWHSGAVDYQMPRSFRQLRDYVWGKLLTKAAIQLSHRLVTGPQRMVGYYAQTFGTSPSKIAVVPNDVNTRFFHPVDEANKTAVRRRLGIPLDKRVFLIVHRLSPIRRTHLYFSVILTMLRSQENALLVVVGDGPDRAQLEAMAHESGSGSRVRFAGSQPRSSVRSYYQAADVFLNPSYVEGFPRVIVEAMASALPVLATSAGGTVDLFPEDCRGWVVERDDVVQFQAKCDELAFADDRTLQALGARLLQHAQQFSTDSVAALYARLIVAGKTTA